VALIIWIYVALERYMANGPYWYQSEDQFCKKNWWTNILYVNNLVNVDESVNHLHDNSKLKVCQLFITL